MTISELVNKLKKLGKTDSEINEYTVEDKNINEKEEKGMDTVDTKETTGVVEETTTATNKDTQVSEMDTNKEGKTQQDTETVENVENSGESVIFEDGWLVDGQVDLDKITDSKVKEEVGKLVDYYSKERSTEMIKGAVESIIQDTNCVLDSDKLMRLLDMDKIGVEDKKVVGLTEQIDALKASDPALFKKQTNPMSESFSPTEKKKDIVPTTLSQAFELEGYEY